MKGGSWNGGTKSGSRCNGLDGTPMWLGNNFGARLKNRDYGIIP